MKDKKILWFDVETTGLDAARNDIIQLAYIIEINGDIFEKGNIFMQPFEYGTISREALEVTSLTIEKIKTFKAPAVAYEEFVKVLEKYINRFDKDDKFYIGGFNVNFDYNFLNEWFKKNGADKFAFGSFFNHKLIDPLQFYRILDFINIINSPIKNNKLETLSNKYGIDINAHDALSDITATRNLFNKLKDEIIKK